MQAFDVLGDPIRRRILELLADGERSAGEITSIVMDEFGISQPGVSQHLRVLRESGFTSVRPLGARRLYAVEPVHLKEVDVWLDRFRELWEERYERLDEVLRDLQDKEEKDGRKN
jgi:DNA-binding transcriptional ArsR family regulator